MEARQLTGSAGSRMGTVAVSLCETHPPDIIRPRRVSLRARQPVAIPSKERRFLTAEPNMRRIREHPTRRS